ncbi:MAG TPA: efflux RND transporter periplasmic adaptor subunit [Sphingorhabdus sp.]|jgi:membrane fusion protein (multidrug efflux system)|nr:efflux RND transporter periplasmic adaptor subunit [Sphingorhabdus sp.]
MNLRFFPLLALLLTACGGGEEKRDRPTPLVVVAPVATHQFADRYVAVGNANANEQVSVRAPVTERITQLGFTDGAFVKRGQMLAVLAQGQETASLASAQARVREADRQLERVASLQKRGFATNASLDSATATAQAARAAANEAGASVGDRVVRAPFSGQVSLRRISVGAVVSAGDEIATVSDIGSIKLDFTIPETMLAAVRTGQAITAKAAAYPDAMFSGRIEAIDPVINVQTRTATLRAIIPNRGGMLKPGMLVTVTIESNARVAIAVPELALVREGDTSFVYTIDPQQKAKRISVKTGARDGNLVEIVEGLKAGDKIVTEGVVKLSDGAKVRVKGAGDAPPPKSQR